MWRDQLLVFAEQFQHPAWGVAHAERVYRLATGLAAELGEVSQDDLFAAALLHDAGAFPVYKQAGVDHAVRSAEVAGEVLPGLGFPAERVPGVQAIIRGHMYYAEPADQPEAVAFHDADTLDFLGDVGIARILAIVGLDDWAPDLPSAVKLIERFARELPSSLRTPRARAIAAARRQEMATFLSNLADQTDNLKVL